MVQIQCLNCGGYMEHTVRTAIVLQGGGALGAYEYGVMQEFYEARGPQFKPTVITGISIGAINAAILAGAAQPLATLDQVWREGFAVLAPLPPLLAPGSEHPLPPLIQQRLSLLGNASMYRLRPEYLYAPLVAPFVTTSVYDTAPLREMLTDVVDLHKLNDESQVVVTAVNVETGKLARFGNTLSIREGGTFDNQEGLTIDHILASGSLPPSFPMTTINGACYWDGGLYSNTPLAEAINCLEKSDGGSREVKRELIVVELFPMVGQKPGDMQEVMSRILNLLFASKLELDEKLFRKYSQFIDLVDQIALLLNTIEGHEELQAQVEAALRSRGSRLTVDQIRGQAGYQELIAHTKIDAFTRIPFTAGPELANATDFSKAAIEARIEAGRREARNQNIGEYHYIDIESP